MRILIANRGEIARRVIRTAHRLGHETVAVHADPDAAAPFVTDATVATRIGPADLAESYLSIDALLAAAERTGATAVHPGYGFLSERAEFARAVVDAGMIWIGPSADAIDRMGSKIDARRLAADAGVPTIPGFDASQDDAELRAAADRIGYPVLVKASAGGGGKGIRIASSDAEFARALDEARSEAGRSFGNSDVIVERYITRPRHVEVQIVGDAHGNVIHLGTRECSVQRRYQKVLEEAPAPHLTEEQFDSLTGSAVALAAAIGYRSAGTVEFVLDDDAGDVFFLEMNTRLQVEHPVTEEVTGLDLVELQLRVAEGEALPFTQDDVRFGGHAFEARINAEDAGTGFAPRIGLMRDVVVPASARWESGVEPGSVISPHYDSMVAKLVVHGPDRSAARRRLAQALDQLVLAGPTTTTGFHRWLIEAEPVVAGRVTTRFLDETELPGPADVGAAAGIAAAAWLAARDATGTTTDVWRRVGRRRVTPHRGRRIVILRDVDGSTHEPDIFGASGRYEVDGVDIFDVGLDGNRFRATVGGVSREWAVSVDPAAHAVAVNVDGHTHEFAALSRSEHWAPSAAEGHGAADVITSPFPAVVSEVRVSPGDVVAEGDVLVVIEAMKMLHSLTAHGSGTVDEVRVAVGDHIQANTALVTFVPEGPAHEEE